MTLRLAHKASAPQSARPTELVDGQVVELSWTPGGPVALGLCAAASAFTSPPHPDGWSLMTANPIEFERGLQLASSKFE